MSGPRLIVPRDDYMCDSCAEEPAYIDMDNATYLCGWCAEECATELRVIARQAQLQREAAERAAGVQRA